MNKVEATRYDGQSSTPQAVLLTYNLDETISIEGDDVSACYALKEIKISPRVGKIHARIQFPDQSLCEISDYESLQAILPDAFLRSGIGSVHHWENRLRYIVLALLITTSVIWAVIEYGLPAAAKAVAERIPVEWETAMGQQTLDAMETLEILAPTTLAEQRRDDLLSTFTGVLQNAGLDELPRIEFRNSEAIGANALALPSGIIIFTDEMVKMAEDDRELLGILAHELAHIEYRHGMRHVLQNSALALMLIMITGDVGSASSLAATLPTLLAQAKYSREFEQEADDFAIAFMDRQGLERIHLANILHRLGERYGDSGSTGYLDTHPATQERVKKLSRQ